MAATHIPMGETHIIGPHTQEWVVTPGRCPMLRDYGFQLIGRSAARPGFAFTRQHPIQTQWLGCVSGRGDIWLEGQWRPCLPDHVYLTPPDAMHAYRAAGRGVWQVCWVIHRPPESPPESSPEKATSAGPRCVPANVRQMDLAIQGLYSQTLQAPDIPAIRHWLDLIDHYIRITPHDQPGPHRQAMDQLWKEVARSPGQPWTMEALAERLDLSEEHVRRLSMQYHDRPPMHQVRWLRMQHAEMLLLRSDKPIHAIAQAVGYHDPFAFQSAFARVMGITPAACRRQGRSPGTPPNEPEA